VSRLTLAAFLTALFPILVFAADLDRGSGSMTVDGKQVKLVDAFAYSGELVEYDEDGKRLDNYDIVLTSAKYDHAAIAKSAEPVSDYNYWLMFEEEKPASLTIRLKSTLRSDFLQARLANAEDSQTLRCYCEGVVSEVKLENGRLKGRIHSPKGLRSLFEGQEDDPTKGRSLAFDVTIDVPVVAIQP
jgi:hypothetical protein